MPNTEYSWNIGRRIWNSLFEDFFMRDDVSDAQTTIPYSHHEIHEGDHYFVEDYATLGSAGTRTFVLTTPNSNKQSHMLWAAQSTGAVVFNTYEYGSTSSGGTAVTPQNSNRNYANNSTVGLEYNPTIVNIGTRIGGKAWGVTGNPAKVEGGGDRAENEMVLGTNRKYIYHFKSNSDANVISYHGNWYEHTPSN